MRLSVEGQIFIQRQEGLSLKAYPDGKGPGGEQLYSIGYGHNGVARGTVISELEARRLFVADVARFERCVNETIGTATQAQFDALVSLCYNIGTSETKGFPSSTVARLHNAGDFAGAADAFRLWKKSDGKVNPILVSRRETELALYSQGEPAQPPTLPPSSPPSSGPGSAVASRSGAGVLLAGVGLVFFCRGCGEGFDSVTVGPPPEE